MTGGWWESAVRISRHCAATHRGRIVLTYADRAEAALDGIVQFVHDHEWPRGDLKPVFQAGANAIDRASREAVKHIIRGEFWLEPSGASDALAESVTDRVAVWQVIWALSDDEWEVVWAVAEVMARGGNYRDAAALLGKEPQPVAKLLHNARTQARALWVAPGDTPPRRYTPTRTSVRLAKWQYRQKAKAAA